MIAMKASSKGEPVPNHNQGPQCCAYLGLWWVMGDRLGEQQMVSEAFIMAQVLLALGLA